MSSQIPFTPLTPESMARLTLDEQMAFEAATMTVAQDQKPSLEVIATLVLAIQRLITEPSAVREQAKRYLVAVYGEDWLCRAPETFTGVDRWIWAVANSQGPMAETAMAGVEQVCAERRAGGSRG